MAADIEHTTAQLKFARVDFLHSFDSFQMFLQIVVERSVPFLVLALSVFPVMKDVLQKARILGDEIPCLVAAHKDVPAEITGARVPAPFQVRFAERTYDVASKRLTELRIHQLKCANGRRKEFGRKVWQIRPPP